MEIIVCVLLPFCCIFVQNFVDKEGGLCYTILDKSLSTIQRDRQDCMEENSGYAVRASFVLPSCRIRQVFVFIGDQNGENDERTNDRYG